MAIYLIIFTLFFIASMLEVGGLKKSQSIGLFYCLAVILTLFVGLRYHTGADWSGYIKIFNKSLSANSNYMGYEPGYIVLNKLFKVIFNNYYVLQFACSLFFIFAVSRFYRKETNFPITALLILVCLLLFEIFMAQVRQSIAVAIIILGANYIFDRKILHFLCIVFIASLFHISAIVAIPLYFLYRNWGKIVPIIIIVATNIIFFFPKIIKYVVLWIVPILPTRLATISEDYFNTSFAEQVEFSSGLFYIGQTILIILVVSFVKIKDNKMAFFVNASTVFAAIKALSNGVFILTRLQPFYLVFAVVAFTFLIDLDVKKITQSRLIFAVLITLFFLIMPVKGIYSTKILPLTNRPANYPFVPYYNCISHPQEATLRKDWNQN